MVNSKWNQCRSRGSEGKKSMIASKIKKFIKLIFYSLGIEVKRLNRSILKNRENQAEFCDLPGCIIGYLAAKSKINIVQIGANDGKQNDPIFKIVNHYSSRSTIVLIEPQEELIPILKENYKQHPRAVVINSAVGEIGKMKLFSINPEHWSELDVPYAKNWPAYRAPTGVTSLSKEHVRNWLKIITKKTAKEVDGMILERIIKVQPLENILIDANLKMEVDVLQVDAEGFDDVVLYNSINERILPKIINFEYRYLKQESLSNCVNWLENHGYNCFPGKIDMLCVRA
jgi:FkbM family methyltransferase